MTDYRAGRQRRLCHRNDISRVFDYGARRSDSVMTLLGAPRERGAGSRAAAVVTKRHGSAIKRNRIKRLCREAFRMVREELPEDIDYVVMPRAGAELTLAKLENSIRALAARLPRERTVKPAKPDDLEK